MVEAAGVELAYGERGEGRPVLLVHGMADDSRCWEELAERVARRARVITYDRRGYGASGAPDPYQRTTVQEQTEDAAALLRRLRAAPAVVCGRDFGALVCLDLAKRHRSLVRAAAVVEPPLYAFAAAASEALAEQRLRLEQALRDRGPAGAVAEFLTDQAADERRLARARAAAKAFFADYGGLASWPVTRRELRELDLPLTVITGRAAPLHARQAAAALTELAPRSRAAHDEPLEPILLDLLGAAS